MNHENPSVAEVSVRPSKGRLMGMIVAVVLALALGFAGGVSVGAAMGDGLNARPDAEADLSTFWKVWNALEERFVATGATSTLPLREDKLWGAIQGLAASYGDPYTVFMSPEEAKQFHDDIRGDFQGVGMEIGVKEGVLTIIAPLKGTPADRAGLRAGDAIIMIDGKSTDGMSSDAAVKMIRGEKGTSVAFTIVRDGAPLEVTVVRDVIQIPTIETEQRGDVFIISFYSFTANANQAFTRALNEFNASGASKLVVDVRNNPGGYLDVAVAIASHFLPRGAAIVTEDYAGKQENTVLRSKGTGTVAEGTPIVVLIDRGSASASEIVAGALRDANVATLIGTASFGKGSVQELLDIDGGALKVTIARWLTPSGDSISDGGLKPDIEVAYDPEDYGTKNDAQLDRAIEFLRTGK